jgi:DNA-binding NtrC family response regulator
MCRLDGIASSVEEKQHHTIEDSRSSTKTILLVEDDDAISELLVQMIEQETPHKVYTASDGPQALNLVKAVKPNLLILDYWLPSTQGIELYDRLGAEKGLKQVPTIMLSANAPMSEVKKRPITFIKKPFDMDRLLQTIRRLLR